MIKPPHLHPEIARPGLPASGSELSLHIPSWHAVLSDPGESDIDMFQNVDADMAFAD
jgi:hypothetical protein